MTLLLDTHVLLWWLSDVSKLSTRAGDAIADPSKVVLLSAVVVWECRIKEALGKLTLPIDFEMVLEAQPFVPLSITAAHAHGLKSLPDLHRDPFDRLLISQAKHEGLTLVTADPAIARYPIATLW
ncbi:MAG: twitching motility protein PilT [Deltaproteobacteria bacterium RIFOXYA12_FULL_61_11]|nr:MAG: twitching motility protein PilT [Deltaproteobacteria bacterium RIFOXYA12_FULL_61_11]